MNFKLPRTSQLSLSDQLGGFRGDYQCGPLTFYAYLRAMASLVDDKSFPYRNYQKFLNDHFPNFNKTVGFTMEYGLRSLMPSFPQLFKGTRLQSFHRKGNSRNLCAKVKRQLEISLKGERLAILQIAAHHAELCNGKNVWQRGLGHFVLLLKVSPHSQSKDHLFFEFQYWDPWDAKVHDALAYEELFRDFKSYTFPTPRASRTNGFTFSPSGHQVLSPELCVLAPSLDLYSPKVYFSQRYIYTLEGGLF